MKVKVIGPRDKEKLQDDATLIYTVSRSTEWSRGLSPFFLGPCLLYDGYESKTVENAWQYCKVYRCHTDAEGNPTAEYWKWAKQGWANPRAVRYTMGKGVKPEYSLWAGQKLGYIEARKKIYIPIYYNAVKNTDAYKKLRELYLTEPLIYLWDFDGYDYEKFGMTLKDVANNPDRGMGHAFILAKMLEEGK